MVLREDATVEMVWVCDKCDLYAEDLMEGDKAVCMCGEPMRFNLADIRQLGKGMKAVFDYSYQLYRDIDSLEPIRTEEEWDFPCPRCRRPAKLTGISVYEERHLCLNCDKSFGVN